MAQSIWPVGGQFMTRCRCHWPTDGVVQVSPRCLGLPPCVRGVVRRCVATRSREEARLLVRTLHPFPKARWLVMKAEECTLRRSIKWIAGRLESEVGRCRDHIQSPAG